VNISIARFQMAQRYSVGTLVTPKFMLYTMELPWMRNQASISCVPPGLFELEPHHSRDHPHTWALVNPALGVYHEPADIPAGKTGRYAILLHPANWPWELRGCIGPGIGWNGSNMVTSSKDGMNMLRDLLGVGSTGHRLRILEPQK